MSQEKSLIEKLSRYGLDVTYESQKSLQQKIIQMYEILEQKTTQNLLLTKQNDDIKLQIKTINEVFTGAKVNFQDILDQSRQIQNDKKKKLEQTENQKKIQQEGKKYHNQQFQTKKGFFVESRSPRKYERNNQNEIQIESDERESIATEQKTPRYSSKPHKNSRFCQNQKPMDKNETSRMISSKMHKPEENGLNQKIQFLMRQNEAILKRMNQIEVNFISKQQDYQNPRPKKNFDDRETNFSSNITSIHNIWTKKETMTHDGGFGNSKRKNYSTSNLKSYCPSIV